MIKLTKIPTGNTPINEWSEAKYTKNIRNNAKKELHRSDQLYIRK